PERYFAAIAWRAHPGGLVLDSRGSCERSARLAGKAGIYDRCVIGSAASRGGAEHCERFSGSHWSNQLDAKATTPTVSRTPGWVSENLVPIELIVAVSPRLAFAWINAWGRKPAHLESLSGGHPPSRFMNLSHVS